MTTTKASLPPVRRRVLRALSPLLPGSRLPRQLAAGLPDLFRGDSDRRPRSRPRVPERMEGQSEGGKLLQACGRTAIRCVRAGVPAGRSGERQHAARRGMRVRVRLRALLARRRELPSFVRHRHVDVPGRVPRTRRTVRCDQTGYRDGVHATVPRPSSGLRPRERPIVPRARARAGAERRACADDEACENGWARAGSAARGVRWSSCRRSSSACDAPLYCEFTDQTCTRAYDRRPCEARNSACTASATAQVRRSHPGGLGLILSAADLAFATEGRCTNLLKRSLTGRSWGREGRREPQLGRAALGDRRAKRTGRRQRAGRSCGKADRIGDGAPARRGAGRHSTQRVA